MHESGLGLLTDESPSCPQPRLCKVLLMQHQKAMLLRCRNIELQKHSKFGIQASVSTRQTSRMQYFKTQSTENTKERARPTIENVGIMMDPPGTGKTFVAVCLVLQDIELHLNQTSTYDRARPTLIVVPQYLVPQWQDAVRDVTGCEPYSPDMGHCLPSKGLCWTTITEYAHVQLLYQSSFRDALQSSKFKIVLTSSILLDSLISVSNELGISYERIMFDEYDLVANQLRPASIPENMFGHIWLISASLKHMLQSPESSVRLSCLQVERTIQNSDFHDIACACNSEFIQASIHIESPIHKHVVINHPILDINHLPPDVKHAFNSLAGYVHDGQQISSPDQYEEYTSWQISDNSCDTVDCELQQTSLSATFSSHEVSYTAGEHTHELETSVNENDDCACEDQIQLDSNISPTTSECVCPCALYFFCPNVASDYYYTPYIDLSQFKSTDSKETLDADELRAATFSHHVSRDSSLSFTEDDFDPYIASFHPDQEDQDHVYESKLGASQIVDQKPNTSWNRNSTHNQTQEHHHDKISTLLDIISNLDTLGNHPKVIIAADNVTCLQILKERMQEHHYRCEILDGGNITSTSKTLQMFHKGSRLSTPEQSISSLMQPQVDFLLLNTKTHCHGLNLQIADAIILMHKLQTIQEYEQVIGRAQRPGRVSQLVVYHVLHHNEYEDYSLLHDPGRVGA